MCSVVAAFRLALVRTGTLVRKRALQFGVEPLFLVELRAVAGQIEQLDLVFTRLNPSLDRLAVIDAQVIENQKLFFARVLDQGLQKLNQFVRVKGLLNDHPACLALICDGGDHR